jgi:hypothetical protein
MVGKQSLVGGDDVFAGPEGGLDRIARRIAFAADEFDENIDLGRACQCDGIVNPFNIVKIVAAAGFVAVARRHGRYGHRPADS